MLDVGRAEPFDTRFFFFLKGLEYKAEWWNSEG
jgi:hypothetical protein